MKIIVPMAGKGSRLRPHTLTTPKPLIPVAGTSIVQRLVEGISAMNQETLEEVAYIIGPDFGKEVEMELVGIAEKLGAKGSIYYQEQALGTAHAILCAAPSLEGNLIVAFADTLFTADFKIDTNHDGLIYVKQVDDPRAFGVVKISDGGFISDFVEKPVAFVSDLAIIGIYYFKDGANLRQELQYLIDNNVKDKGEYQLTSALENMKNKGLKFYPGTVVEWLDCGNKDATVYSNQRVLENGTWTIPASVKLENSVIIQPCYIGENVSITNSVVGPHVSVGNDTVLHQVVLSNSIVQKKSKVENRVIHNSMIGSNVHLQGRAEDLSIGDYTSVK
ncbi:MAG: sugar phosphate nucleotidyltransferase [Chitinophagales bacterium]|nr:sugar phosphate nucleotidyltransferase [Chitinophagales bacterium]